MEKVNDGPFPIEVVKVKIKRTANAKMPAYAHKGDAGMDLYSSESCVLKPMERKLVSTGISIELPLGYEAQTRPKSGLALKNGISLVNTPGTIDSCYRGEIKLIMINLGSADFSVDLGMKIAQLVIKKVEKAELIEVEELTETSRNEGGFGSTGN